MRQYWREYRRQYWRQYWREYRRQYWKESDHADKENHCYGGSLRCRKNTHQQRPCAHRQWPMCICASAELHMYNCVVSFVSFVSEASLSTRQPPVQLLF
eukprot:1160321-Pelagomonas_calceolata.AAC.14